MGLGFVGWGLGLVGGAWGVITLEGENGEVGEAIVGVEGAGNALGSLLGLGTPGKRVSVGDEVERGCHALGHGGLPSRMPSTGIYWRW